VPTLALRLAATGYHGVLAFLECLCDGIGMDTNMKSTPLKMPTVPFSEHELELIELFIREQSGVVMRACRMEVTQTPIHTLRPAWVNIVFPWVANRNLHLQLQTYRRGVALQLLLEKQLIEALTYLNDPSESTRELFVNGAFKALYACEEYSFGNKASHHIQEIIHRLGLQI
jgi:hypothetical protein